MANNSQEAFNELQAFQNNRRKSQDILRESENTLGLPSATQRQQGLRAAITNTENLIRSVDPSVSGRTSGSLVTEAQKTRLVGLERQPLDEAFRTQSDAYQGETTNVNELKRRALQDSQLAISEDDAKQNALQGVYSNLYQREQDEIARQERERAFQEQQRQVRAAAAQNASFANLLRSNNNPSAPTSTPQATSENITPVQQEAYNDVANRRGQSFDKVMSDYAATAKSANYGNQKDKFKVLYYRQLFPQFFQSGQGTVPGSVLANGGQLSY